MPFDVSAVLLVKDKNTSVGWLGFTDFKTVSNKLWETVNTFIYNINEHLCMQRHTS